MRTPTATGVLLAFCLLGAAGAQARDKTSPEYLREKHAGRVSYHSANSVGWLFPRLKRAAEKCWTGTIDSMPPVYGGMAAALIRSAWVVDGRISENGDSAYVVVGNRGPLGTAKRNFLQIDLSGDGAGGTRLEVLRKNNAKLQRAFEQEVQQWLDGREHYCAPKPAVLRQEGPEEVFGDA